MAARPARGDREYLARKVRPPSLLELPTPFEECAVLLDLLPQLRDVLTAHGLREDDRRVPVAAAIECEDRAHLVQHRLRRRQVHLVDRDHVGDLHDPCFQSLHGVAGAGHEDEQDGVGDADHLDLALPRPDGLEEDEILAGRIEHEQRLQRRLGEPAEVHARTHRADEDVGVEEVVAEPDPVAEKCSLRERTRRIDRDDADRDLALADVADQRGDEARLPDPGRAGHSYRIRRAGLWIEIGDDAVRERVAVLHERDGPCEGAPVSLTDAGGEALACPVAAPGHRRIVVAARRSGSGQLSALSARNAPETALSRRRSSSSPGQRSNSSSAGSLAAATSASAAVSAPRSRASVDPARAATSKPPPATPQIQRGPIRWTNTPPNALPAPASANVTLITNVSARPRSRSNVPRWTSSALEEIAAPFPMPATTQQPAATHTSGLAAVAM